jgi:hypothetical protein
MLPRRTPQTWSKGQPPMKGQTTWHIPLQSKSSETNNQNLFMVPGWKCTTLRGKIEGKVYSMTLPSLLCGIKGYRTDWSTSNRSQNLRMNLDKRKLITKFELCWRGPSSCTIQSTLQWLYITRCPHRKLQICLNFKLILFNTLNKSITSEMIEHLKAFKTGMKIKSNFKLNWIMILVQFWASGMIMTAPLITWSEIFTNKIHIPAYEQSFNGFLGSIVLIGYSPRM